MSDAQASAMSSPTGHGLRRAATVDDTALRRRPRMGLRSPDAVSDHNGNGRRSSNFSDYSLSEARGLLNPGARPDDDESASPETSSLAALSLAFALLPAIAGSLFKNGSAVVTDILLLGLAGVFLHWSVTQPWKWYHSAQQVRVNHQSGVDSVIEDDSDFDLSEPSYEPAKSPLEHVSEEDSNDGGLDTSQRQASQSKAAKAAAQASSVQQQAALRELYRHEVISLLACFALPLVSAYLLHAIRAQLSRPSEGLVSNYNLTIFLLVSELRVFSHMIKLFQSRTLHLQRVVHANPYSHALGSDKTLIDDLLVRLQRLESQPSVHEALLQNKSEGNMPRDKGDADIAKDVRNTIQPDLDALNRAVRRYEKKATLLQLQTESRFAAVDARLEDAIALAAAAAKNSAPQQNILLWTLESTVYVLLLPFNALIHLALLPLRTLRAMLPGTKQARGLPPVRSSRGSRGGKTTPPGKYNGDKVPSRVYKR